ncbi:MAG: sulfatase [Rikenellaceae bacterium]
MQKIIIPCLVIGAATGCKSGSAEQTKSECGSRPNIILFVTDDHGRDALGCYGNPVIKTPNLDALAASGVRFENAFCTSSTSAASRSVLLTGQFGHATGSYGHVHDYHHFSTYDNVQTLPVLLAKDGYSTARIGKYHVAPEKVYHFDQTFEADPRSTVEMADACGDFIKDSKKPFFLYFCPDDPHRGDPFKPEKWEDPNNFGNREGGYPGAEPEVYNTKDVLVPGFLPDTEITRREIAEYYQSISRIDKGFGRLMELLKASGKADNTLVVYISDNGMAFPGAKTTLYEAGMRLPCIIDGPMVKGKNEVSNAMISWVDITPTLLDIAGVKYDKSAFHGHSFRGALDQSSNYSADEVYGSHQFHEITMYYPMRVLRERQYKLFWNIAYKLDYPFASDLWDASTWQQIEHGKVKGLGERTVEQFLQRPEFELYDISKDPNEVKNLAADPKYKKELERMKSKLKKWQMATSDPWFIMWDHDAQFQGTGVNL